MTVRNTSESGFTLLLAALTASLLLVLGASVFGLVQKSIILSSLGRDSQFAFYAADTAAECALYWDARHDAFSPSTTTPFTTATCDGQNLGSLLFASYGTPITFQYQPNGYCARVSVTKNAVHPQTVIEARGYNVPCASIDASARALERAAQLAY
jgi:hypothetical protein